MGRKPVRWRVATSHSRIPSVPALAGVPPSGLKATEETVLRFVFGRSPLIVSSGTFHSRTVPSVPPLASLSPSGLNAAEAAELIGQVRTAIGYRAAAASIA